MHERLQKMFKLSTDQEDVKIYAERLFKKRNGEHFAELKKKDKMSKLADRNLDQKLEKWRLKERKHEFHERIN